MHRFPEDIKTLERLRKEGVLKDVDNKTLPRDGAVVITCADGDQIHDIVGYLSAGRFPWWTRVWMVFLRLLARLARAPRKTCTHTLGLNGGALLIPLDSPLNAGEHEVLFRHTAAGLRLKKLETIAALAHYPCGAARAANMSLAEVIHYLQKAAGELRKRFPDSRVVCLLHIDWGPRLRWGSDRKRTYLVDEGHPVAARLSLVPSIDADAA